MVTLVGNAPRFAPDSSEVYYAAERWNGGRAYLANARELWRSNGNELNATEMHVSSDQLWRGWVVFNVHGERSRMFDTTYVQLQSRTAHGFVNKKRFVWYSRADSLVFGAAHFAFRTQLGNKWFVVVDGTSEKTFDDVGAPQFSENGTTHAYVAREQDETHLVVNGAVGHTTAREKPSLLRVSPGPDGRLVAAFMDTAQGAWALVVWQGGAERAVPLPPGTEPGRDPEWNDFARPYSLCAPVFDSTSTHIAFIAVTAAPGSSNAHWLVVLDGNVVADGLDWAGNPAFDETGTHLSFAVRVGDELAWR